jgi:hypothetical protein
VGDAATLGVVKHGTLALSLSLFALFASGAACGDDLPTPTARQFGFECGTNSDCDSARCSTFPVGKRCSITCPSDPDDCPNDGAGCNTRDDINVCNLPEE